MELPPFDRTPGYVFWALRRVGEQFALSGD